MPHPVLEALVAALVPAARHEEVLGDLCERYTGPWRYVFDALQVVLAVLITQVLRVISGRQREVAASPRCRAVARVPAVGGRLTVWLASSRAVGGRSLIGLVGTAAWFALASLLHTTARVTTSDDSSRQDRSL